MKMNQKLVLVNAWLTNFWDSCKFYAFWKLLETLKENEKEEKSKSQSQKEEEQRQMFQFELDRLEKVSKKIKTRKKAPVCLAENKNALKQECKQLCHDTVICRYFMLWRTIFFVFGTLWPW